MEDIPKRQRSSKFDTRRRHIRNTKPRDVHCGANLEERKEVAEEQKPGWNGLLGWQQDPALLGIEEHQRQRSIHRRQIGLTAEVTVLSTAVISIGVDISGNPTATSTTTLPTGLPTTLITSSTSYSSADTTASTSSQSDTSSPSPTATTPDTSSTTSTSAELTITSGTADTSSAAVTSGINSTKSQSTTPTTSGGFIASTPGAASSSSWSTSDTSLSSRSSSLSSTSSPPSPAGQSTLVSTPAVSTPSIASTLSISVPLTSPTTVSGFGFVTSTSDGFIGNTPIGASHSFSGNGTSSTFTSSWTSSRSSSSSSTSVSGSSSVFVAGTESRSSRTTSPTSSSRSTTRSRTSETSSSTSTHSSRTSSRTHSSSSLTSTSSSSSVLVGGGGGPSAGAAPTSSSPAGNGTVAAGGSGNQTSAGVIAGSVVGSLAGFAFILLLALAFLRWYKRRQRLTGAPHEAAAVGGEDPFRDPQPSSGGMTQPSSTLFPAAAMGFLSRFSRHQEPEQPAERGFQKISGRKLPSQFSPGMEASVTGAPQLPLPVGAGGSPTIAGPAYLQGFQAAGAAGPGKDKDIEGAKDVVTSPTADSPIDHPTGPEDTTAEVTSWYRDSSISTATAIPPGSAQMTTIPPRGSGGGRGRYSSSAYSVDTSGIPYQTGTATAVQVPPPLRTDREQLMPGPQRTPTVRHAAQTITPSSAGGAGSSTPTPGIGHGAAGARPSTDSPPVSPTTPARGTLGRSHPSLDGSRGSRFTEGVE